MTREQRLVVALTDIRGIHWQCRCGATMTIPIDHTLRVQTHCPGCRDPFSFPQETEMLLTEFLQGLKTAIRVMQDKNVRATLSLDLADPVAGLSHQDERRREG